MIGIVFLALFCTLIRLSVLSLPIPLPSSFILFFQFFFFGFLPCSKHTLPYYRTRSCSHCSISTFIFDSKLFFIQPYECIYSEFMHIGNQQTINWQREANFYFILFFLFHWFVCRSGSPNPKPLCSVSRNICEFENWNELNSNI